MTHFEKLSFCSEGNLYVNFKRSFALDAIYINTADKRVVMKLCLEDLDKTSKVLYDSMIIMMSNYKISDIHHNTETHLHLLRLYFPLPDLSG